MISEVEQPQKKAIGSRFPSFSIACKDELIMLQKMLHHYSFTWVTREKSGRRVVLNQRLRFLLAMYFKFGFNEDTKQIAAKCFGVKPSTINTYNHVLTKDGYLVSEGRYSHEQEFNKELLSLRQHYLECMATGQAIYFMVKFQIDE